MKNDEFGVRMKAYEAVESSRRLNAHLPVYARIDGRSFSKFTRDMDRPFDQSMTSAMIETARHLVQETHAQIGFTQSDEVSLIRLAKTEESQIFFSGKVQKTGQRACFDGCGEICSGLSRRFRGPATPFRRTRIPAAESTRGGERIPLTCSRRKEKRDTNGCPNAFLRPYPSPRTFCSNAHASPAEQHIDERTNHQQDSTADRARQNPSL